MWYPPMLNALARTAIADRKLERAETCLNAVTLLVPHDAESWFLRARVYRKRGQLDDAGECLQRAREAGLPLEQVRREECLAQAQSGQFREAAGRLSELLTDPRGDEQEICEAYVLGAVRTRRTGLAHKLLELWIADFPQVAYPRLLRGRLWMQSEVYESAASDLQAAINLDASLLSARLVLAEALIALYRPEEAREALQPTLSDDRWRAHSLVLVAVSHRMQGDPEMAARTLAEALILDPASTGALRESGRLKLDSADAAGALAILESAFARQPDNLETRYLMAQALQSLGRAEEARSHFQFVADRRAAYSEIQRLTDEVERDPDNAELRFRVGELTLRHGDSDDAVLWLLSVLDVDADHVRACRLLAEHYAEKAAIDPKYREIAATFAQRAQAAQSSPAANTD